MDTELTYDKIYKTLFVEGIEEFVPDGVSISHPVVDLRDGHIVDCFILYSQTHDRTMYTVPTARIIIDAERKKLIDFKSTEEQPFSVYDGIDYFTNDIDIGKKNDAQMLEQEYQNLYMEIRKIAFKKDVTSSEKEIIIRYIKSMKTVEYIHLQSFLYELGKNFFQWAKNALR